MTALEKVFDPMRQRTEALESRLPKWASFLLTMTWPVIVFLLVIQGIRLDRPRSFFVFAAIVGAALWVFSRAGVLPLATKASSRFPKTNGLVVLGLAIAFPLTQLQAPVWIRVGALAAIYAALALGLNIVVGRAGLLDLGYAAFFGIGAYSAALLSECVGCPLHFHVPWGLSLLISALIGALFGVILGFPVLRLRGDYLAIVTLGFGEIIQITLNNFDNVPFLGTTEKPFNLTNGPNGLFGIGHPAIGPLDFSRPVSILGVEVPNVINYYYVGILVMLVIIFVIRRLDGSRIGRAWTAIREDEGAAQAMGINTTTTKLLAFAAGAFFGGIAGNVFVHLQVSTSPQSFSFIVSVTVLAMVVLGGMGNIKGVVIGALILIAVPEKLQFLQEYRFLIFGLTLMLIMRFRPGGFFPEERRRLELEEAVDLDTKAAAEGGA